MREIKFRAWDEKEKKMFNPSSISWKDGVLWVCDSHGENKLEYELINPNSHLMQYTGLKDKNGVEIYEGDIVKSEQWYPQTYKVIFEEGSFGFKREVGDYLNSLHYLESFEVIGNIYQNPELIEKKWFGIRETIDKPSVNIANYQ